jgi:hypothetical protein
MKGDWRRKYTQKYELCLEGKYLGKEERERETEREKFYNHFS